MEDADDGFLWNTISTAAKHVQPGAIVISLVGLTLLILWQTKAFRKVSLLPAGLLVVVVGTLINVLFQNTGAAIALDSSHLVKLPVAASIGDFFSQFLFLMWQALLR